MEHGVCTVRSEDKYESKLKFFAYMEHVQDPHKPQLQHRAGWTLGLPPSTAIYLALDWRIVVSHNSLVPACVLCRFAAHYCLLLDAC
jgi:hypothetical protein